MLEAERSTDQRPSSADYHSRLFSELSFTFGQDGNGVVDRSQDAFPAIEVAASRLVDVVTALKGHSGLNFLDSLTAVDQMKLDAEAPRFCLIYQFLVLPQAYAVNLKVFVAGDAPSVPSLQAVFGNAEWHEREAHEMFGIDFTSARSLDPLLLPEGWDGYPMRKDYVQGETALGLSTSRTEGGLA